MLPCSKREVYPRVCGGTLARGGLHGLDRALSPRVRGNLDSLDERNPRLGSIPACAGEPGGGRTSSGIWTVYPRVCGGTGEGATQPYEEYGLSPRVRGNHVASLRQR